jgi:hypothetical protein
VTEDGFGPIEANLYPTVNIFGVRVPLIETGESDPFVDFARSGIIVGDIEYHVILFHEKANTTKKDSKYAVLKSRYVNANHLQT